MSTKKIDGEFYVVDDRGDQFDGPYPDRDDAERAAQDFEQWHRVQMRDYQ